MAVVTLALVSVIEKVAAQIAGLESRIAEALVAHQLVPIFQSVPRSGTVRAASLLAEIGACKARFPTPQSLACLAGVAPPPEPPDSTTRWSTATPRRSG